MEGPTDLSDRLGLGGGYEPYVGIPEAWLVDNSRLATGRNPNRLLVPEDRILSAISSMQVSPNAPNPLDEPNQFPPTSPQRHSPIRNSIIPYPTTLEISIPSMENSRHHAFDPNAYGRPAAGSGSARGGSRGTSRGRGPGARGNDQRGGRSSRGGSRGREVNNVDYNEILRSYRNFPSVSTEGGTHARTDPHGTTSTNSTQQQVTDGTTPQCQSVANPRTLTLDTDQRQCRSGISESQVVADSSISTDSTTQEVIEEGLSQPQKPRNGTVRAPERTRHNPGFTHNATNYPPPRSNVAGTGGSQLKATNEYWNQGNRDGDVQGRGRGCRSRGGYGHVAGDLEHDCSERMCGSRAIYWTEEERAAAAQKNANTWAGLARDAEHTDTSRYYGELLAISETPLMVADTQRSKDSLNKDGAGIPAEYSETGLLPLLKPKWFPTALCYGMTLPDSGSTEDVSYNIFFHHGFGSCRHTYSTFIPLMFAILVTNGTLSTQDFVHAWDLNKADTLSLVELRGCSPYCLQFHTEIRIWEKLGLLNKGIFPGFPPHQYHDVILDPNLPIHCYNCLENGHRWSECEQKCIWCGSERHFGGECSDLRYSVVRSGDASNEDSHRHTSGEGYFSEHGS